MQERRRLIPENFDYFYYTTSEDIFSESLLITNNERELTEELETVVFFFLSVYYMPYTAKLFFIHFITKSLQYYLEELSSSSDLKTKFQRLNNLIKIM